MVKIGLQFRATLQNLTDLEAFGDTFRWYLKLECINCGEEPKKWQYMTLAQKFPITGSRGLANLVYRCKFCNRESTLVIFRNSLKKYTSEDSEQFKTIVSFDCRGLKPTDFSPRSGFRAVGKLSSNVFEEINLKEKNWFAYDADVPVSISEIEYNFIRIFKG